MTPEAMMTQTPAPGTAEPLSLLATSTERLLATVDGLSQDAVTERSTLPGWTRGHVLAHIAYNADGLRNLVAWARTGEKTPMYASPESRNADIEAGAPRPLAAHREHLARGAEALAADLAALPAGRLDAEVFLLNGKKLLGRDLAWQRMAEVEIHHVDLDAGHTPEDWPPALVSWIMDRTVVGFRNRDGMPAVEITATDTGRTARLGPDGDAQVVTGPEHALFAWLCGRSPGHDLSVKPGPIPAPPTWP
ncbi:MAG: maleylpyruvate isomerase family mycothiol-dependent enzyme [Streptosporangiales bacterium]|nr:maleylpyruvate isomerase family mycothiol-dependent enzyme [Streptosporangiales bacterium]